MFKRLFDIVLALILLILMIPFIPVIMLFAMIINGKPLFIKVPCVGRKGKVFNCYLLNTKFAHHINIRDQSIEESHKLLFWEKIILFFKFYLWPVLFNIIKGNMSFVGPIPEPPEVVESYTDEQKKVLTIRPGFLGASFFCDSRSLGQQLNLDRDSLDYYINNILPIKIKNELQYIEDTRIGRDVRLVIKSIVKKLRNIFIRNIESGIKTYNFLIPIDIFLLLFSYFTAYHLRFEWSLSDYEYRIFFLTLPIVLILRIFIYDRFGLYKNIWKYVGVRDLVKIIQSTTISSILIVVLLFFIGIRGHSRAVFLIDWMLCISLIGGSRLILRMSNESINLEYNLRKNVLIIGAGDVGDMLLRELERNARDKYNVVGFIDDNKQKHGMTLHGVRVFGGRENIPHMVQLFHVDEVFIAIALISANEIKSIIKYCKQANVRHRIVPAVADSLSGSMYISKIRKVDISDLFGRKPVQLDISSINDVLEGKRILVTGAGGSIGSELCRQISEYKPESLILVDKNENYLHEIRIELSSSFVDMNLHCVLSDITDEPKQKYIFDIYQPELVFHAAAQKHVPLCEENPDEAIRSNIIGTKVMANLALHCGASHFILVSTDKAVNPTSIMGATKRIAELYIQSLIRKNSTNFITVRFGNVLNSNGSVVPTFMKQIEKGGPITITDQNIERYFMSIDEAVQLILQSVTMGKNGQIFILDMGKSIKIIDLAIELIHLTGAKPYEDIDIQYTGLRPGEKLYEELIGKGEYASVTSHTSIKALKSDGKYIMRDLENRINLLSKYAAELNYNLLTQELTEIIPEYTPSRIEVDRLEYPVKEEQKEAFVASNYATNSVYSK